MKRITYARASALLRYDPKSGHIYWKQSRGRVGAGQRAGTICKKKSGTYSNIEIDGKKYGYGPIAWLLMTGKYPKGVVDFRNNNPRDTRWANLVLADLTAKLVHASRKRGKLVGLTKMGNRWRARYRRKYLGMFASQQDAMAARVLATPPR